MVTFNAVAEMASGNNLPAALKDIKPASGICRTDGTSSSTSEGLTTLALQPDLSCAITVTELQGILAKSDSASMNTLVDMRPNIDYQSFHIEGALSLNSSDLHTKPYWRSKTVVLIGSGKAETELYRECSRLKQSGYKQVRVLKGGMPMWLSFNAPVLGRAVSASQLSRLSASEFWLESKSTENLVVLAKEKNALQKELPLSIVLQETTPEALKSIFDQRRKALKNTPILSVVLATTPDLTELQIGRLQQAVSPTPLLIYTDTRDAFLRQVAVQKAIWVAQARGPKQPACGL